MLILGAQWRERSVVDYPKRLRRVLTCVGVKLDLDNASFLPPTVPCTVLQTRAPSKGVLTNSSGTVKVKSAARDGPVAAKVDVTATRSASAQRLLEPPFRKSSTVRIERLR